jgi:hypothetical protein
MGLENQPPGVRARLEAARSLLEKKDLPGALAVYEEVLAADGDNGDVLAAISGDLGATGNLMPIIELTAPHYDPERHGPAAGLNLLQAYLAVGDPDSAKHVLDRLFALGLPELGERLHGFSNAIAELIHTGVAAGLPGARPRDHVSAKGAAVSISKPIWFYGFESLEGEILPAKAGGLRRIAFTQLALPGAYADVIDAMKRPEDERARLSRALPLWLAETFYFSPQYAPITALAFVTEADGSKHAAILDSEWTIENMRQLVNTTKDGLDYVFTGTLAGGDGVFHLTLRVWDAKKFRERKQFSALWTQATADAELAKMRDTICRFMEWRPCADGDGLGYPGTDTPRLWLDGLGASLGLFLTGKKLSPLALLAPLAPAFRALRPLAGRDPAAALAWLTMVARARELGIDVGPEVAETALFDHPVVAKARELLK